MNRQEKRRAERETNKITKTLPFRHVTPSKKLTRAESVELRKAFYEGLAQLKMKEAME